MTQQAVKFVTSIIGLNPIQVQILLKVLNLKTKRKNLVSFVTNEFQKVLDKIPSSMKG